MYFEFRDALLHTSVVMSGSLNYCCLPVSLKLSGHSPLTSGINEGFLLKELLLTGYFLFTSSSVNPRDRCAGKSQVISSFQNTQTSPCGTNSHVQTHLKISFLSHSDACSELQQVIYVPCEKTHMAMSCCCAVAT